MLDVALYARDKQGQQVCNNGDCQCVALANDWCSVNGWPRPTGATAASLSFPAGWTRFALRDALPGDLIEWHASLPGSNGDGHIGIYLAQLGAGFQSLDQNWSRACCTGPVPCCCQVEHTDTGSDLAYVAGAWRWSSSPPVPAPPPTSGPPAWPESNLDLTGVEA